MPEFVAWPKISRLYREIIITEKIDGTNAAIGVSDDLTKVWAQSRTRIITPEKDNFGFARFVDDHPVSIAHLLGPGLHFGEWCGSGIQRGYGLPEKWFALFNVKRWRDEILPERVTTVPVLYEGVFSEKAITYSLETLREVGSFFVEGFKQPEGIVVYHVAANTSFKVTLENDEAPKGVHA